MRTTPSVLQPGRHVVITGASSGLGLELACQLAELGVALSLIARDPARLAIARDQVLAISQDGRVAIHPVDVADQKGLTSAIAESSETFGAPHVLVNSAGIIREGYFEDLTDADYRDVMETNLFGSINAVRSALPYLKQTRGAIVNIASVAGLSGVFGFTPYCASKHALIGFTNALRFELEPQGLRVQLVCPAEFETPMVKALDRTRTPENRAHTQTIPEIPLDQVARETIRGIRSGAHMIVPGWRTRGIVTVQRLAPGLASTIGRRRIAAARRDPDIYRC